MQTHFDKSIAQDGEFPVHAASPTLAVILIGPVELYVEGPEDADRLIKAAVKAKRLMEARAESTERAEPEPPAPGPGGVLFPAGGWCPAFTVMEDDDVTLYCDREAGHPGSHHAPGPDEGSEVAWGELYASWSDKPEPEPTSYDRAIQQAEFFARPGSTVDDILAAQAVSG